MFPCRISFADIRPRTNALFLSALIFLLVLLVSAGISAAQTDEPPHAGMIQDWSHNHFIVTAGGTVESQVEAGKDPRAVQNWIRLWMANQYVAHQVENTDAEPSVRKRRRGFLSLPLSHKRDWQVNLFGALSTDQYPAKYSFNVSAPPDCINDFVVFGLNVASSTSLANLDAFNQLYSGTVPAGFCAGRAGPNTYWAYNTGSSITQSVALSLSGKRVAFVDSKLPNSSFHVLGWRANSGTILVPTTPTVVATSPGPDQMTNLVLAGRDVSSAPYIDYAGDLAYVGTNTGQLYRIKNVFCTSVACISGNLAPSVDTTWGITGIALAGSGKLNSPVYDPVSRNVFVTSGDGKLYGFTKTGIALANSPLKVGVGSGTPDGGIIAPPLVDATNGFIYVVTGDNGTNSVVAQVKTTNFSVVRTASLGKNNVQPIHLPALNNNYKTQATNTVAKPWYLYSCGYDASGNPFLYRVGFDASRNMNTTIDATVFSIGANAEQCTAMTEFATNGVDRLYLSVVNQGFVGFADITNAPTLTTAPLAVAGGVSGIIIDNVSPSPQASSIYFTSNGAHQAVKLTQVSLQ